MSKANWLQRTSPAFRLMIATSWLAPESWKKCQEEAIREALKAGPDWAEYLCLVNRHRIPALSWTALSRVPGIVIPGPVKQELQKRNDACRIQAIRHCRQLEMVLKAFNRAGIPVMNLKGPILSAELYGDVGLRQSKDLDLVVCPDDLRRAQTCLDDMGWQLDSEFLPETPRQWEKFWRMEHELAFTDSQRASVLEIRWRIDCDPPSQNNARWIRSIPSVWQGCSYQAMNPVDQVLYLCNHGGVHIWFRAKWLGDLARIHADGRMNWEAVLDYSRSSGQEKPLLTGLVLLDIVYRLPLPRYQGNPWKNLPSFLINSPLCTLKTSREPLARGVLESLPEGLYRIRYPRMIQPPKSWGAILSDFLYRRQDFRVLRLPDRLFWAYAPLRPILFAWRWLKQARTR